MVIVLERGIRESLLEEVTFDETWKKRESKPHRNLTGVHLGRGNFMSKGPEAGRRSLGVGGRKANKATAKLVKQRVEEMRFSFSLAPSLSDCYLLNVSPDLSPYSQLPSELSSVLQTRWSKYVSLIPLFSALYFSMDWLNIVYRVSLKCLNAGESPLGPSPYLLLYFLPNTYTPATPKY